MARTTGLLLLLPGVLGATNCSGNTNVVVSLDASGSYVTEDVCVDVSTLPELPVETQRLSYGSALDAPGDKFDDIIIIGGPLSMGADDAYQSSAVMMMRGLFFFVSRA